ncbi:hypothetical protein JHK85_039457 [Glycine max]|nr:hypothetical protein JHK86_038878 [Glycine max]KAG4964482.1 hypothetical protein JHK85_039457 [Glycine max]
MGLSRENLKGLILALVSSGFIGASFIIKKQGLRRAAAVYGVRAGVGGYYYLLEPLWWVGMITTFLAYVGSVIVLVFILVFHFAPRCGHTNVLVFTGICSLMGSLSCLVFLRKIEAVLLPDSSFELECREDWDGQSGGTIVSEICGFIVVLSGTIMLHATKDFERSSSFRGVINLIIALNSAATDYPDECSAPSSPTLSARLFTGNGDSLLKQDEENGSPESNMCSRRQELY